MTRRPPYRLVADTLSTDTIECLAELLDMAQRGRVTGIAFAVMMRGSKFAVNAAGEAHRSPVFARGMVAVLDDELRDMARHPGR